MYRRTYLGVTVLDSEGAGVIMRSLVEQLHTVLLGSEGRGEMDGDHLQHGISGRKPLPHHSLQQRGENYITTDIDVHCIELEVSIIFNIQYMHLYKI